MSRAAIFFLVFVTLGLAILLALLGWATARSNLLGWFLLITGGTYFVGVIVVYWVRGIRFWRPRAEGEILEEERHDWSFWFIVAGMIAAFYLPPLEYLFLPWLLPHAFWLQIAGSLIVILGATLFIWARRVLGSFYSGHVSVIEGQPLVRQGPYHFLRHPAYAGYILITLGLAVGYTSLIGLAAILFVLLPTTVYRIRVEDKLLARQFCKQFEEYAHSTKRLIPFVW